MLVCVAVLLAGSMAYAGATGQLTTLPGRIGTTIAVPFQKATSAISEGLGNLWVRYASYGQTQAENEALQARIAELEQQLVQLEQYQAENEQLREFYGIKEDNPNWEMVPAFVVGRDPMAQFYSFTVDTGALQGVAVGNPVVSASGSLVGLVVETGAGYARVKTVLDPSLAAAVMVSRTRDAGIAAGNATYAAQGQCLVSGLPREATVTEGDLVVTSGLGGAYPAGLIIGTVQQVMLDASGGGVNAVVQPAEDVSEIYSVMIITGFT